MQESSRRQILRGMAAASMLPSLGFLRTSPAPEPAIAPTKADTPAPSQTLAVIFHGLFAFLFGNEGDAVQIVVPCVKGHKYWAGNHLQEDRHKLRNGRSYRLAGVGKGKWTKKFDFPFLSTSLTLDKTKIYCQISIPWPDCLMFDHQVTPVPDECFFSSPSNLKPSQLPTIYGFFYYDTTIACRPEFKGTSWKAPRTMGQPGEAINANLHIRAEHCVGGMGSSGWDTFSDLFGLKDNERVTLNPNVKTVEGAKGMGPTVPDSEDDFLAEEHKCKSQKDYDPNWRNSPTNCASIGGCKPGTVC